MGSDRINDYRDWAMDHAGKYESALTKIHIMIDKRQEWLDDIPEEEFSDSYTKQLFCMLLDVQNIVTKALDIKKPEPKPEPQKTNYHYFLSKF